jgi:HrpA-like RNA helicase
VAALMASCQEGAQQGGVPIVSSEGRSYPVKTSYLGGWERRERQGMENAAAAAIAGGCGWRG